MPSNVPPVAVDRETILKAPGIPRNQTTEFQEVQLDLPIVDASADLAAFVLDDSVLREGAMNWFDLQPQGTTPGEGETVLAIGYPADLAMVTLDQGAIVFSSVEWTKIAPPLPNLKEFDPSQHFLAKYTETEADPDAKPGGFSGCAMWFHRPAPLIWPPNLDIAGLTIAYYPGPQVLLVVRREALERFLSDHVGSPHLKLSNLSRRGDSRNESVAETPGGFGD